MAKKKHKDSDINTALDLLDGQIEEIVTMFVNRRKKAYLDAVRRLRDQMRSDAIRYSEMLAEEKITLEDYQRLLQQSAVVGKILVLEQVVVSRAKFDQMAGELALKTAKTLIPIVIGAL